MNLINQINEKFQQVELPFMAFEHDMSFFTSYYLNEIVISSKSRRD